MDVVIVGTANDNASDVLIEFSLRMRVDLLEVREGLEDGLPV